MASATCSDDHANAERTFNAPTFGALAYKFVEVNDGWKTRLLLLVTRNVSTLDIHVPVISTPCASASIASDELKLVKNALVPPYSVANGDGM